MEEALIAISNALEAGEVQPSEVLDLVARGKQRRKSIVLEKVSKALDDGATEAEFIAVAEKRR